MPYFTISVLVRRGQTCATFSKSSPMLPPPPKVSSSDILTQGLQ